MDGAYEDAAVMRMPTYAEPIVPEASAVGRQVAAPNGEEDYLEVLPDADGDVFTLDQQVDEDLLHCLAVEDAEQELTSKA